MEHVYILLIDDLLNLDRREIHAAERDAALRSVRITKLLDKVNQDVRAAPFTRMNTAKKVDARTARNTALADLDRMAFPPFPGFIRQFDQTCKSRVRTRRSDRQRILDVWNVEIVIRCGNVSDRFAGGERLPDEGWVAVLSRPVGF